MVVHPAEVDHNEEPINENPSEEVAEIYDQENGSNVADYGDTDIPNDSLYDEDGDVVSMQDTGDNEDDKNNEVIQEISGLDCTSFYKSFDQSPQEFFKLMAERERESHPKMSLYNQPKVTQRLLAEFYVSKFSFTE